MSDTRASSGSARADRRPRDMILSLAVLLVPIALIFGFWQFIGSDRKVSVIDPLPSFHEAADAGLDILPPEGLPAEWKPMSSIVNREESGVTLRIGYQTPDGAGVQLMVSNATSPEVKETALRENPRQVDVVETDTREWGTFVTGDHNNALVWDTGDTWIIIYGDAQVAELVVMASALDRA